jgi:16S rRNA processing protein RimM
LSTTDGPGRDPVSGETEASLLDVGRVVRPHGLAGEVVVDLVSNRAERSVPGSVFFTDHGELTIESARPFQHRWLVNFVGVQGIDAAEALRGRVLRAPPLDDPDALWVHELVGSVVLDQADGRPLGTVTAVVANPISDLLELDGGNLIPVRYVVDHQPGQITIEVLPGMLD